MSARRLPHWCCGARERSTWETPRVPGGCRCGSLGEPRVGVKTPCTNGCATKKRAPTERSREAALELSAEARCPASAKGRSASAASKTHWIEVQHDLAI